MKGLLLCAFLLLGIANSGWTTDVVAPDTSVSRATEKEADRDQRQIKRLVFVGDSITCGIGVKNRDSDRYPALTVKLLQKKFPKITEINLGQSGYALGMQSATYANELLAKNPDAVVIQWGVNDQYSGFSVAQFAARYEQLVQTLRNAKPDMPIVLTTLVADYRWPDNFDLWIGEANVAIQEIAARYKCHVAYVHRAINHDKELQPDGIHPNNAGAEIMAKAIFAAFATPALSNEKLEIQFDQGNEVRFMQYVFMPRRNGVIPQWIRISNISKNGMCVETQIPVAIRTAPIYSKGIYTITVKDKSGVVSDLIRCELVWQQILCFTLDPKKHDGPFTVEINPEPAQDGKLTIPSKT